MDNDNSERRLDVATKISQMGEALISEGNKTNDKILYEGGCFLRLISSVLLSEKDTDDFANICSMYSAKKMFDGLNQRNSDLTDFLDKNIS
jgi:hypothetical protein